jgi:hypothetical protein
LVAALTGTLSAHAQELDSSIGFSWRSPEDAGCATKQEIHELVQRLTRRVSSDEAGAARSRIVAVAYEEQEHWLATITLVDSTGRVVGTRRVTAVSSSCRALDEAVAVVIATLADGLARDNEVPAADGHEQERTGLGSFLAGAVGLGSTAWFGAGFSLELPIGVPLVLDATGYLPVEQLDSAGRGARFWGFHGGAALCPSLLGQTLALCGGTEVGAIWASGMGLTESRSELSPIWLFSLGPKIRLLLSPAFAFELSLSAALVPVKPRFHWEIQGQPGSNLEGGPLSAIVRLGIIGFPF